jgi:hypothetical protein
LEPIHEEEEEEQVDGAVEQEGASTGGVAGAGAAPDSPRMGPPTCAIARTSSVESVSTVSSTTTMVSIATIASTSTASTTSTLISPSDDATTQPHKARRTGRSSTAWPVRGSNWLAFAEKAAKADAERREAYNAWSSTQAAGIAV